MSFSKRERIYRFFSGLMPPLSYTSSIILLQYDFFSIRSLSSLLSFPKLYRPELICCGLSILRPTLIDTVCMSSNSFRYFLNLSTLIVDLFSFFGVRSSLLENLILLTYFYSLCCLSWYCLKTSSLSKLCQNLISISLNNGTFRFYVPGCPCLNLAFLMIGLGTTVGLLGSKILWIISCCSYCSNLIFIISSLAFSLATSRFRIAIYAWLIFCLFSYSLCSFIVFLSQWIFISITFALLRY